MDEKKEFTRNMIPTVDVLIQYAKNINPQGSCVMIHLCDSGELSECLPGFEFEPEHYLFSIIQEWAQLKREKIESEKAKLAINEATTTITMVPNAGWSEH